MRAVFKLFQRPLTQMAAKLLVVRYACVAPPRLTLYHRNGKGIFKSNNRSLSLFRCVPPETLDKGSPGEWKRRKFLRRVITKGSVRRMLSVTP